MGPGGDGALDFGVFAFLPFSLGPAGALPVQAWAKQKTLQPKKVSVPPL